MNKKLIISLLTIVVFSVVAFYYSRSLMLVEPVQAQGTTYYVCPDGSCDYTHPQQAADIVNPGDTVIVKNGTYTDTNGDGKVLLISKSGAEGAWITFKSEDKWGAVIDGSNYVTGYGVDILEGSNYIRIEGFEIKETKWSGIRSNALYVPATHHLYYIGNKVHNIGNVCECGSSGKVAFGGGVSTEYVTLENNVIYDIGRLSYADCIGQPNHPCGGNEEANIYYSNDHGMYMDGDHYDVINNIFYGTIKGWSIKLTGAYEEPHQGDGDSYDCSGDSECKAEYWNIIGNTFDTNNPKKSGQLLLWQGPHGAIENILIQNNIFYDARNYGIASWGRPTGYNGCDGLSNIEVSNNLAIISDISLDCPGITQINNIISADPDSLFEDAINHDYRLKSNSPAINQGVDLSGFTDYDIDGNLRDSQPDLGAYEYQSSQTCGPSDLNCDSSTNTQDIVSLKNLWGQSGKADLNQNNITDVSDIGIMMKEWEN